MNKSVIATAIIALLIGSGIGYWVSSERSAESAAEQPAAGERKPLFYRNPMNPGITSPVPAKDEMGMDYVPVYAESDQPEERKPLFYRNPMNPAITSPVPAKDEMGMDYVPVYPEGSAGSGAPAGTVKIDATMVQDIGVRTTAVERSTLSRQIRTIGRVAYDEERIARLHPKYDGWVEKLFVDKTGELVTKGSVLLSIYSPQIVATQEEYLLALNSAEKLKDSPFADVREGAESLLRSTKERLQLLDVPERQINQLKAERKVMKGVRLHSPFNGIVMNIGAREGERITPATELYMITDLSRVWVIVDIYEDDMPWVRKGDTANMQVAGIPGRTFTGKVTYIYPYLEAKTRTLKIRLEFDNRDLVLKPDMFANIDIQANKQVDALVVPSEAIVRTGTQEQVFIQRAPGQFEPRSVTVGVSANGQTQIVSGLKAGEIVVTSSQFLLDSESKLKEATAKMLKAIKPDSGAAEGNATQPAQSEAESKKMRQHDSGMEMGDQQ
ncbi:MAG: efflux transporter periplasmic adaptor subunit [Thiobacillus sp. SCN 63-1177]|nr:MAG: efflux transporter periplasmic adaptor subunit [Thiobacillus sp. SCN 63-1177]